MSTKGSKGKDEDNPDHIRDASESARYSNSKDRNKLKSMPSNRANMPISKVNRNYQVTIPKAVRQKAK